jgi:uncharacterized protein YjgD (DUF1641 family)
MSDTNIQSQIDEVNRKLDLILEEAASQRQNRETITDLVDDLAIVGKDAFGGMVSGLDNAGIELDAESLKYMVYGFIRNINNINVLLETLESTMDLVKDVGPIVKEVGIDAVEKFREIDDKGYFEVLRQFMGALDNVMKKYPMEDLETLGEKIESVFNTLLVIIDPAFMNKIGMFVETYKSIDHRNIPEYSIFRVMRELNKPGMKKSIGFIMTFLKEINAKETTA